MIATSSLSKHREFFLYFALFGTDFIILFYDDHLGVRKYLVLQKHKNVIILCIFICPRAAFKKLTGVYDVIVQYIWLKQISCPAEHIETKSPGEHQQTKVWKWKVTDFKLSVLELFKKYLKTQELSYLFSNIIKSIKKVISNH